MTNRSRLSFGLEDYRLVLEKYTSGYNGRDERHKLATEKYYTRCKAGIETSIKIIQEQN